jgi:transcriptional regulator of acetoin/glycerol metabolism
MQALIRYPWPGNVRELEHVIERAVALATHSIVWVDDLPSEIRNAGGSGAILTNGLPGTLSALHREHVLKVLESTGGNKERAARLLGISRRTLYRFLDRYGLPHSPSPSEPTPCDFRTPSFDSLP